MPTKNPISPREFFSTIAQIAYTGSDDRDSCDKVRADLKGAGIDPDAALRQLQARLKAFDARQRLEAARAARLAVQPQQRREQRAEPRASVIEQIRQLLMLNPSLSVFANRWENSSDENLISIRDRLAEAAAQMRRNAQT